MVPRVMPTISPRACGSQCGGAEAGERGHEDDAVRVDDTVAAIAAVSAAEPTSCRPSRSHCTAAPVTKIDALEGVGQLALGGAPGGGGEQPGVRALQASVPVLVRMNDPVP